MKCSIVSSCVIASVLALPLAGGCGAKNEVPELVGDYNPRVKARQGKAMLRGVKGVYVEGVDGQRVENVDGRREAGGGTGGNAVPVPAGSRRIRIVHQARSNTPSPSYPGLYVRMDPPPVRWEFDFTCEKDHTYEFSVDRPAIGLYTPDEAKLIVTDVTLGESLVVSNDDRVSVE